MASRLLFLCHLCRVAKPRSQGEQEKVAAQRRPLTRRQRAHWRLSWAERQARNARARTAPGVEITLFGLPSPFATFLGLSIL